VQVGLLRLTALVAKLAPGSGASGGGRLMLWFLQCLLGHCLSAVNTFVAGEVHSVLGRRPDVMDRYLAKGASFCSRQARQPGDAMATVLRELQVILQASKDCRLGVMAEQHRSVTLR
jgi:hypothetical protein